MAHHFALFLPFLVAGVLLGASDVVPGMNRFAVDSYHQLATGDTNAILSPFNISTALSMLLEGARGQTAEAIAATLHQQPHGYSAAVASLAADLTKIGNTGSNELSIANAIWLERGLPLETAFENSMRTLYQAPLTPLAFSTNPNQARGEINAWTAQHTKDKIQELLGPGAVTSATRLVLTSAIYFYGKWQKPFNTALTRPEPFHLGTTSVETGFMHQQGEFSYTETPSAQILQMPYAGTSLAFVILLPKTNDGLPDLERSLDSKALGGWLDKLAEEKVEVTIPKFRAESQYMLADALSHMGMATIFSHDADFSGIDGRRDLYVSAIVHKAFVDVSEKGTEAAAATGTAMRAMAMRRPPRLYVFRADHPFVFFIRDASSGAILFEGRFVRPASS